MHFALLHSAHAAPSCVRARVAGRGIALRLQGGTAAVDVLISNSEVSSNNGTGAHAVPLHCLCVVCGLLITHSPRDAMRFTDGAGVSVVVLVSATVNASAVFTNTTFLRNTAEGGVGECSRLHRRSSVARLLTFPTRVVCFLCWSCAEIGGGGLYVNISFPETPDVGLLRLSDLIVAGCKFDDNSAVGCTCMGLAILAL